MKITQTKIQMADPVSMRPHMSAQTTATAIDSVTMTASSMVESASAYPNSSMKA